ncbi:MAG: metallopeptidase [Planctomycetaceae bacterium]|nr:metallopeptidase [Planctomycetaceae bacterium]
MRIAWGLALLTGLAGAAPEGTYEPRAVEGWTVLVERPLLDEQAALGRDALRLLEVKLYDVGRVVPSKACAELRRVPIYLCFQGGSRGGPGAEYHPDAGWLKANGYSTDLAKCVHIPRAEDLATIRNIREQPWVILHELAHAYHDQVLDFNEPRIVAAYEAYKKSGHGDNTLLFDGTRVKHYALTDQMEFFAEMTESYFGSNDFFPFNRAELKESEPAIYALMQELWEPAKKKKKP